MISNNVNVGKGLSLWGKTINREGLFSLTNSHDNGMLNAGTNGVVWAEAPGDSIRYKIGCP
jgi:hypothetical protein